MRVRFEVGIVVVAALVGAVTIILGVPGERSVEQWVLVEASAVALMLIGRAPLLLLAVELVLTVVSDFVIPYGSHVAPLAAGLALGAVAYRYSGPVITGAFVATFAAVLFTVIRNDHELLAGANGVVRLLSLAAAVGAPVAFGCYLAGLRRSKAEAEERARAERESSRLAERARISNDVHDLVAHHVSAIAMRAGSARYAARLGAAPEGERLEEAAVALDAIHTSAGQALVDLRGMLHVLRDPAGADLLLDPEQMIADAVERSRAAGLEVRSQVDAGTATAPLAVRVTAARVVQEALTNALKHAGPGSDVTVRLERGETALGVIISNTLSDISDIGLPASGHGLAGMRERVEILGGTLTAGPDRGGWTVDATLPLAASGAGLPPAAS
ncbi:hypothetical protein JIG36_30210 [Actinoplanes sp. LDG1-06]|uniref:histidine kinase n=1 Tax=Paractinoplanes ovalisporus TaxID=2810368 RepID=A0ABS2AIZ4_9ACTN|nr:histidine kinase [Actinoplanes ovalisporus]MBM2619792.1 hypothetical protein [Actinoplanes ovalisporus]